MAWTPDRSKGHPLWLNRKVLVICSRGNSRSVALAWLLKDFLRADAVAVGADAASPETMEMLCRWAETIIIVDKSLASGLPHDHQRKLLVWDVGPDQYFRGFEESLLAKYRHYINAHAQWCAETACSQVPI